MTALHRDERRSYDFATLSRQEKYNASLSAQSEERRRRQTSLKGLAAFCLFVFPY